MNPRSAGYGLWIPKFTILSLYSLLVFSTDGNKQPNFIGCLPCCHRYLTATYFNNHNSVTDPDFDAFLLEKIGSGDLCKGLDDTVPAFGLSDVFRHLSGDGSHRQLVSTIKFNIQSSDVLSQLSDRFCKLVIIERLPNGVFADPFELQHLVQRREFLDAAVFGDTNLELPSALSNRSIVEIHVHIEHEKSNLYGIVSQLPLHARYPPLDGGGYAKVTFDKPDIFLSCRPKTSHDKDCSWTVNSLDAESANRVTWLIPSGNEALTGIVSNITFISALLCTLVIVFTAIYYPKNYVNKES